jgi:hypothetical protein
MGPGGAAGVGFRLRAGRAWRAPARLACLVALAAAVSCSAPADPQLLPPEQVLGSWVFQSSASEWCQEFGPVVQLRIRAAEPTLQGRLNLFGEWEHAPPNPEAPNSGEFSGNLDRASGDFELVLWRQSFQIGELRGVMREGGNADGSLNWGICRPKRGARVSPP